MQHEEMIKVLFVCLGNICRSPMAEAVFRHLVENQGLSERFIIASAGTGGWHVGEPPHQGTQRILQKNNIPISNKKASQITRRDIQGYNYIVAMDAENVADIQAMFGKQVSRLLDFHPDGSSGDVPDPYYTGEFDQVFRLVLAGCEGLLAAIREKEKI